MAAMTLGLEFGGEDERTMAPIDMPTKMSQFPALLDGARQQTELLCWVAKTIVEHGSKLETLDSKVVSLAQDLAKPSSGSPVRGNWRNALNKPSSFAGANSGQQSELPLPPEEPVKHRSAASSPADSPSRRSTDVLGRRDSDPGKVVHEHAALPEERSDPRDSSPGNVPAEPDVVVGVSGDVTSTGGEEAAPLLDGGKLQESLDRATPREMSEAAQEERYQQQMQVQEQLMQQQQQLEELLAEQREAQKQQPPKQDSEQQQALQQQQTQMQQLMDQQKQQLDEMQKKMKEQQEAHAAEMRRQREMVEEAQQQGGQQLQDQPRPDVQQEVMEKQRQEILEKQRQEFQAQQQKMEQEQTRLQQHLLEQQKKQLQELVDQQQLQAQRPSEEQQEKQATLQARLKKQQSDLEAMKKQQEDIHQQSQLLANRQEMNQKMQQEKLDEMMREQKQLQLKQQQAEKNAMQGGTAMKDVENTLDAFSKYFEGELDQVRKQTDQRMAQQLLKLKDAMETKFSDLKRFCEDTTATSALPKRPSVPTGAVPTGVVPTGAVTNPALEKRLDDIERQLNKALDGFERHARRPSVPTGAVPAGAVPAGAVPTGAVPTGAVPTGAVPADAVPPGAVPTGAVPMGADPTGAVPTGDVPMGAIPMGADPTGAATNPALEKRLDDIERQLNRRLDSLERDTRASIKRSADLNLQSGERMGLDAGRPVVDMESGSNQKSPTFSPEPTSSAPTKGSGAEQDDDESRRESADAAPTVLEGEENSLATRSDAVEATKTWTRGSSAASAEFQTHAGDVANEPVDSSVLGELAKPLPGVAAESLWDPKRLQDLVDESVARQLPEHMGEVERNVRKSLQNQVTDAVSRIPLASFGPASSTAGFGTSFAADSANRSGLTGGAQRESPETRDVDGLPDDVDSKIDPIGISESRPLAVGDSDTTAQAVNAVGTLHESIPEEVRRLSTTVRRMSAELDDRVRDNSRAIEEFKPLQMHVPALQIDLHGITTAVAEVGERLERLELFVQEQAERAAVEDAEKGDHEEPGAVVGAHDGRSRQSILCAYTSIPSGVDRTQLATLQGKLDAEVGRVSGLDKLVASLSHRLQGLDAEYHSFSKQVDSKLDAISLRREADMKADNDTRKSWNLSNQVDIIQSVVGLEMEALRKEVEQLMEAKLSSVVLGSPGEGSPVSPRSKAEESDVSAKFVRAPRLEPLHGRIDDVEDRLKRLQECYQQCTLKTAGLKAAHKSTEAQSHEALLKANKAASEMDSAIDIMHRNRIALEYLMLQVGGGVPNDGMDEGKPDDQAQKGKPGRFSRQGVNKGSLIAMRKVSTAANDERLAAEAAVTLPKEIQQNVEDSQQASRIARIGAKVSELDSSLATQMGGVKSEVSALMHRIDMILQFFPRKQRRMIERMTHQGKEAKDEDSNIEIPTVPRKRGKMLNFAPKAEVKEFEKDDDDRLPWQLVGEPDVKWSWCFKTNGMGRDFALFFQQLEDEKVLFEKEVNSQLELLSERMANMSRGYGRPNQTILESIPSDTCDALASGDDASQAEGSDVPGPDSAKRTPEKFKRSPTVGIPAHVALIEDRFERLLGEFQDLKKQQDAAQQSKLDKQEFQLAWLRIQKLEKSDPPVSSARIETMENGNKHFAQSLKALTEQFQKMEGNAVQRQELMALKSEVATVRSNAQQRMNDLTDSSTSLINANRQISANFTELKTHVESTIFRLEQQKASMSDYVVIRETLQKLEGSIRDNRQILTNDGNLEVNSFVKRIILNLEDKIIVIERKIEALAKGFRNSFAVEWPPNAEADTGGSGPGSGGNVSSVARDATAAYKSSAEPQEMIVQNVSKEIVTMVEAVKKIKQDISISKVDLEALAEQRAQQENLAQRLNVTVESAAAAEGDSDGTVLSMNRVQVMISAAARQLVAGSKWITKETFDARLIEARKEYLHGVRQLQTHVDSRMDELSERVEHATRAGDAATKASPPRALLMRAAAADHPLAAPSAVAMVAAGDRGNVILPIPPSSRGPPHVANSPVDRSAGPASKLSAKPPTFAGGSVALDTVLTGPLAKPSPRRKLMVVPRMQSGT